MSCLAILFSSSKIVKSRKDVRIDFLFVARSLRKLFIPPWVAKDVNKKVSAVPRRERMIFSVSLRCSSVISLTGLPSVLSSKQFTWVTACSFPDFGDFLTVCRSTIYFVSFTVKIMLTLQWSFLTLTIWMFLIAPLSELLNKPYMIVPGIDDLPVRFFPKIPMTPRNVLKSILFPSPYEYILSNSIESMDHLTFLRQSGAGIWSWIFFKYVIANSWSDSAHSATSSQEDIYFDNVPKSLKFSFFVDGALLLAATDTFSLRRSYTSSLIS